MATTFVDYTGDGNATKSFSFPSIKEADIKVDVDGVIKTSGNHYNITSYTTTGGGNVVFTSGNIPASPAAIRIFRDTDVDTAKATFTAGSSVKAGDLNNNFTQILYASQEEQNQTILTSDIKDAAVTTAKIKDDAITGAKIADDQINSEHYVDGSIDTAHIADSQITSAKIADGTIVAGDLASNSVTTVKITDANVTTAKIADSNVTDAKLATNSVITAKIANTAVTNAKLATDSVTTPKIADSQVTTAKIADNNVTTAKIPDDAITTAKIFNSAITTDKIANLNVTNAKLSANSVDSVNYVDGSIDTVHIADSNVTRAKIANDAINGDKIADNVIGSEHYAPNSIGTTPLIDSAVTTAKIANANVTTAKIADLNVTNAKLSANSVDSVNYVDGSIDTVHIGGSQVTNAKLASNAVTTNKITDSSVTTAKISNNNVTLAKLASDLKQTTISDSDTQIPTSGAVVDYVAAQIAPLGGLEVIATEVAFPNTQPSSGVVISISDAQGVVVSGSGSSTTGRTVGGSTVTINNFPSSLNGETLAAGVGLMVSSTGSSQTYNYHKLLAAETDVKQLSDDINDFQSRYRVGASNPTSSLDSGDLFFNTGSGKLLVYNGTNSAWEEAQSIGNYFINTISSYSGTGGNSATFNGAAYRFVLSNPGTVAEQHIVSVNGVVQKPNSGTSQPSEGFAIDGSSIIFSSAPSSGADFFIITIGSTVNIGTPSNGTVSTDKLASDAVTTAKIADSAVTTAKVADANVTRAKIADDAVDHTKLANPAVNEAALFNNAVTTNKIADGNVTTAKIADSAVTSAKIADGTIVNADINASAAIAGTKISPDFGSQNIVTTGNVNAVNITASNDVTAKDIIISDTTPTLKFTDSDHNPDYKINVDGGNFNIQDSTNNADRLRVNSDGHVDIYGNLDVGAGIDCTGTVAATSFTGDGSSLSGINTDLVSDTTPQLGGNLDTNNKNIVFADSDGGSGTDNRAVFGASSDLQIFHDGGGSKILHANTGDLVINNTSGDTWLGTNGVLRISNASNNGYMAKFVENGTAELYYDGNKKLETTSSGVQAARYSFDADNYITCNTSANTMEFVTNGSDIGEFSPSGLMLRDNMHLRLGTGNDLRIYHDGSNNYIKGTQNDFIYIATNNTSRWSFANDGHFRPEASGSYDIGSTSQRVRNIYTNDLHLSNEGSSNDVDGTWGDWTMQEGESDLFLKNNRSGKKYKFNLTEVS